MHIVFLCVRLYRNSSFHFSFFSVSVTSK